MRVQRFKFGLFFAALALQEFVSHWYLAWKLSRKPSWNVQLSRKQELLSVHAKILVQRPGSHKSLVLNGNSLPVQLQKAVPSRGRPLIDLNSKFSEELDDEYKDAYIEDIDAINISGTLVREQDDDKQDEGLGWPEDGVDWPPPFEIRPVQPSNLSAGSEKVRKMIVISGCQSHLA